jgi:AcrR family transcriptional regulator
MSQAAKTVSSPRTGRKRERTRGELVAAAEELVAARGIDAISIDDITEAADVAKGTFYTHFADKTDLAAAIAERLRLDLEDKITRTNEGVTDAAERMANGLSSVMAFAAANPVRARAMLRLQPGVVDPDAPMNAGIRGDVALGLKTKRFAVPSLHAGVVAAIGVAMAGIARLADPGDHRPKNPHEFIAEIVTIVLVALGLKQSEAARTAQAAVQARKKESLP